MRLELEQLTRARDACVEEGKELDRAISLAHVHLQEVRNVAERIRKNGEWALKQAKTWLSTRETQQRKTREELARLEKEVADLHAFDESRLFRDKMEAKREAATARVAAGHAGIPAGGGRRPADVAGWETTETTIGLQLERLQAEERERAREIAAQQKRLGQCAQEITEAQREIHKIEQEFREASRHADERIDEAKRAIAVAGRRRDEARFELRRLEKAIDQAETLLRAYERSGDGR